jgi:hypothetical protein
VEEQDEVHGDEEKNKNQGDQVKGIKYVFVLALKTP